MNDYHDNKNYIIMNKIMIIMMRDLIFKKQSFLQIVLIKCLHLVARHFTILFRKSMKFGIKKGNNSSSGIPNFIDFME